MGDATVSQPHPVMSSFYASPHLIYLSHLNHLLILIISLFLFISLIYPMVIYYFILASRIIFPE